MKTSKWGETGEHPAAGISGQDEKLTGLTGARELDVEGRGDGSAVEGRGAVVVVVPVGVRVLPSVALDAWVCGGRRWRWQDVLRQADRE